MAFLEDQTAATMQSVVDQIAAFAVANAGFTALPDVIIAGANTTLKILLKNGMYYYLLSDGETWGSTPTGTVGAIYLRMMRVEPTALNYFDVGTTINAQRYPAKACTFGNVDGPFEGLNLYTDGNAVHAVLEVFTNVYTHLSFGIIDKFGTWTGGEYTGANGAFYATSQVYNFFRVENTHVFDGGISTWVTTQAVTASYGFNCLYRPLPIAGAANNWTDYPSVQAVGANLANATQKAVSNGMYWTSTATASELNWALFYTSPNATTLRTMLIPIYMRVSYELDKTLYHLCGHVPSVKYLNIQALEPKELIDVTWRVYPYVTKFGDTTVTPVSSNHGLAYLRA